jgi:tellurite resistance protein
VPPQLITKIKDQPVSFALPKMTNSNDAVEVMAGILKAVASGEITPDEANRISNTIETYRKTLETSEFENRIIALEQRITQ